MKYKIQCGESEQTTTLEVNEGAYIVTFRKDGFSTASDDAETKRAYMHGLFAASFIFALGIFFAAAIAAI